MAQSSQDTYGRVARALHWITAILVVITFIYGPGGAERHVYAASRDADRQLHETLGLTVTVLVILRLLWRLVDSRPPAPSTPRWMRLAGRTVQVLMYLMLLALPATAISGAWLEGHPLTLLSGIEIAPPFSANHDLGATLAFIHTWLGDIILWTAGVHAAAALFHHYVLRDGVLRSMLPQWPALRERTRAD